MRGNQYAVVAVGILGGSIPASAGKPTDTQDRDPRHRVYPRECGETPPWSVSVIRVRGLSPRVRGNRVLNCADHHTHGSIPASAGKPDRMLRSMSAGGVYPRECGETDTLRLSEDDTGGLSPRVRGNRRCNRRPKAAPGSIPASAGKPLICKVAAEFHRVYPRECGETEAEKDAVGLTEGLSPRVRGNRGEVGENEQKAGSIPASAGKPSCSQRPRGPPRVYPRECGETSGHSSTGQDHGGLSPRVRGNHGSEPAPYCRKGSIPASAGKPLSVLPVTSSIRVYPRECGETIPAHTISE